MFDWIWDIFYGISKSMYSIIDNMLACANMLCGIEPIRYQGTEMDFLTFLVRNKNITYAFVGAVIVAVVLVVIFAIFMIIRTIHSEKIEKTPSQIAVQVGKTVLMFIFIPAAFGVLIYFTNTIMKVLYSTTLGGSPDGLGRFLAGAFGQNARKGGIPEDFYLLEDFNYHSTSNMGKYVDLSDYDYFFSYLASIVTIFALGLVLIMFVDRAISIVILFIVSPISLSTTVLDDGVRFKLWRDQFITKLLTGYGCIIAINIYALIIGAINNNNLVFFDNSTLNNVMKLFIIVGGAVSLTKMMALIGNLVNAGAGSNELRDSALGVAGMSRALGTVGGVIKAPFSATRGAVNFVRDVANRGLGTTIGKNLGFRTARDYQMERGQLNLGRRTEGIGAGNNNASQGARNMGGGANNVKNVIGGAVNNNAPANGIRGGNNPGGNRGNSNNNPGPGEGMVNNAVNNALDGNRGRSKSFNGRKN